MPDESEAPLKSRAEAERAEAHRAYNEAFDLVDRARQKSPEWPEAPPQYDEEKLYNLNTKWDILPDGSVRRPDGLKGPMFDAVWPVLEPILRQQREFNSDLVNHLNRNIEAHRQANHALAQIVPGLRAGRESAANRIGPASNVKERKARVRRNMFWVIWRRSTESGATNSTRSLTRPGGNQDSSATGWRRPSDPPSACAGRAGRCPPGARGSPSPRSTARPTFSPEW